MGVQVKIPTVGESITEVTIASWAKKDGEPVQMDEVIAELESDKATFELTAPEAGVLKILKQAGETVAVGEAVCEIESNGAPAKAKDSGSAKPESAKPEAKPEPAAASAPDPEQKQKAPTGKVKEMRVPAVGESITEVTISTWLKKDGDVVRLDEIIAEVESDKATFELPAEANGVLRIVAKEQESLPIGGLICRIEVMDGLPEKAPVSASPAPSAAGMTEEEKSYASHHPSLSSEKLIEEKGITPNQVNGNGLGGKITKDYTVTPQTGKQTQKTATLTGGSKVIAEGPGR